MIESRGRVRIAVDLWWHRAVRRHMQEHHRFTVRSTSIKGRMVFCSCARVWCW